MDTRPLPSKLVQLLLGRPERPSRSYSGSFVVAIGENPDSLAAEPNAVITRPEMIYKKKKMNSARPAAKIRASAVRDVTKTVAMAAFHNRSL